MNKNPLVSVVVPVFQVEDYVRECIESILNQTYRTLEILLVDDGSTDKSGEICDSFVPKESRVRVFHQKNGGVTCARTVGIEHARGKYLAFVDADDTLPCQAIEMLYKALSDGGCDMALGKYDNDHKGLTDRIISADKFLRMTASNQLPVGLCGKLFSRTLFASTNYRLSPDIVYGEDRVINLRLALANTKPVCTIDTVVYNYRQNTQSASHHFVMTPHYLSAFHEEVMKCIPPQEIEKYKPLLISYRLTYWRMMVHSHIPHGYLDTPFKKELRDDIQHTNYKLGLFDRTILSSPCCKTVYLLKVYILKVLHHVLTLFGCKGLY